VKSEDVGISGCLCIRPVPVSGNTSCMGFQVMHHLTLVHFRVKEFKEEGAWLF